MNTFGESKRTLSDKLYDLLELEDVIYTKDEFATYFEKILEDYALVLKSVIID